MSTVMTVDCEYRESLIIWSPTGLKDLAVLVNGVLVSKALFK